MIKIKTIFARLSTFNALSPLDGRYHRHAAALQTYFSEAALMKYRVLVETQWLLHMLEKGIIKPIHGVSLQETTNKMINLVKNFNDESAKNVK